MKINLVMINKYHGKAVWTFEDMMRALMHLLLQAGFDAHITVNHIEEGAVNILFGVGSVLSHAYSDIASAAGTASCIIFNCEQLESSSILVTDEYVNFLSNYIVMDWCQANIEAIKRKVTVARPIFEMPVFPTFSIINAAPRPAELQYDLGFYGGNQLRRRKIIEELRQESISVKLIQNSFGDVLNEKLMDCRYVLNIHAYETDLLEINRCLRPMAMGIPIISESSTLPASGDWDDSGILFAATDGFAKSVKKIMSNQDNYISASRNVIQFTNRADNAARVGAVMQSALAQLPI